MTLQIVNTLRDGRARYSQTVVFDGVTYIVYFDYNARDCHWSMTLHSSDDLPIEGLTGRKLVVNWNPITGCTSPSRPEGAFLVNSSGHADPGLYDLGESVLLQYVPVADLEALSDE